MHNDVKIHDTNPFNINIDSDCFYCHKPNAMLQCQKCLHAVFCDEKCMELYSNYHKRLCSLLSD